MLSRFHTIPVCHGQTDGQTDGRTDRITISISRVSSSMLMRDKNELQQFVKKVVSKSDALHHLNLILCSKKVTGKGTFESSNGAVPFTKRRCLFIQV